MLINILYIVGVRLASINQTISLECRFIINKQVKYYEQILIIIVDVGNNR